MDYNQLKTGQNMNGGSLVYEVNEVYVYIPAELSAAGFELKIAGSVRIIDKESKFSLAWLPTDLTQQDVASLYSTQADDWTLVDEPVEPPVVIETKELEYADKDYKGGDLELPESIVPSLEESLVEVAEEVSDDADIHAIRLGNDVVGFSPNAPETTLASEKSTVDAVNFELSQLHSIREAATGSRSLTFFLKNGHELPGLYFHDGGTTGLLQALQRYLYLEKDPKVHGFYFIRHFDKSQLKQKPKPIEEVPDHEPVDFKTITPQGLRGHRAMEVHGMIQGAVSGVVGNFVGITRAVRQHLLQDKQLLDVRPGTEHDDDDEQVIQACAYSDTKVSTSPTSSPSCPPAVSPTSVKKQKPPRPPPPSGHQPESGAKKKEENPEASLISDFQIITDIRGRLPPLPSTLPRQPPVTADEWERMRDDEGRITDDRERQLRARVFAGGIEEKLRREAWKYFLNYYHFKMSDLERMEHRTVKEEEYWKMTGQWKAFSAEQEKRFTVWREVKRLINKDVLRTDRDYRSYSSLTSPKLQQMENILRTYTMYNFDLGYVQGMSDLLAPLLVVMDNEVDAFWCFVGFMETVEHHFEMSQEGMRNRLKQLRALLNIIDPQMYQFLKDKESNNLYFCFRWLLVHFKREFSFEDIMKIWEVIWTSYLSPDYSLFIALAVLHREKEKLLNPKFDFSDILQHINGLSKHIPVSPVLELAEAICSQLGKSSDLPDNLKGLVRRPLPSRPSLSSIPLGLDTVVCNPDSRAVPSLES